MSSWHSPQSIFNLGHRAIRDLFTVPVQLQEKVDGSFFAFGLYPTSEAGHIVEGDILTSDQDCSGLIPTVQLELRVRSKGAVMVPDAPMAMFRRATEAVVAVKDKLHPDWQYRGECLDKPKHNALAYDRVPKGNVILFNVLKDDEDYLPYDELKAEADRLGFEVVPQLFSGMIKSPDELRNYLQTISVLGGQKVEGVVIKPLVPMFGQDKKMLFGKFVSEAFKEVHKQAWGESNPGTGDILDKLAKMYGTPTRWDKCIQHLRESGVVTGGLTDIGPVIKEIPKDIGIECKDEIQQYLWKWAWPHLQRMVTKGFPQYYKQRLMEAQFESESVNGNGPVDSSTGTTPSDPTVEG